MEKEIRDSLPECSVPSERDSVQTDFCAADLRHKETRDILDDVISQMRSPNR